MKRDRADACLQRALKRLLWIPVTTMPRTTLIPTLSKDLYIALQPLLQFFFKEEICFRISMGILSYLLYTDLKP